MIILKSDETFAILDGGGGGGTLLSFSVDMSSSTTKLIGTV